MKPTFTTYIPVSITDMYELSSRLEDIAIQTRAEFKVWRYCSTTRAEFKIWRYCSTNTSWVQGLEILQYKHELSSRFGDIAVQTRAEFKVGRYCSTTRAEFKVGRYCSTNTSWVQGWKILQYNTSWVQGLIIKTPKSSKWVLRLRNRR